MQHGSQKLHKQLDFVMYPRLDPVSIIMFEVLFILAHQNNLCDFKMDWFACQLRWEALKNPVFNETRVSPLLATACRVDTSDCSQDNDPGMRDRTYVHRGWWWVDRRACTEKDERKVTGERKKNNETLLMILKYPSRVMNPCLGLAQDGSMEPWIIVSYHRLA